MTAPPTFPEPHRPLLLAGGLGLLWLVLASLTDGVTYHLAPALVAGTPPMLYGFDPRTPPATTLRFVAAAGTMLALVFTGLLMAGDALSGPSLLPFGGAALEAALFGPIGGFAGALLGRDARRRA